MRDGYKEKYANRRGGGVDVPVVYDVDRKWREGGTSGGSAIAKYRVLLVGIIAIAIYSLSWGEAGAQSSPYPGGVRDPDIWYYCYSSQYDDDNSLSGLPWEALVCEHLMWDAPGGSYESVLIEGSVAIAADEAARVQGYIVPSAGMKEFVWRCDAFESVCVHNTGGSFSGLAAADFTTSLFGGDTWITVSPSSPPTGQCATTVLDVVGEFHSGAFDRWVSPDLMATWESNPGTVAWPFLQAQATNSNANRSGAAGFSCQVIEWSHWPEYLETNPPWVPGPGDLVAGPTPTPGAFPDWEITPWVPITDSISAPDFDLGEPQTEVCTIVIPGYAWTWDAIEYGWDEIEICSTEYDLTLGVFGVDVGGYLVTAFLLAGVGVLVSIIKRA